MLSEITISLLPSAGILSNFNVFPALSLIIASLSDTIISSLISCPTLLSKVFLTGSSVLTVNSLLPSANILPCSIILPNLSLIIA